MTKKVLYISYDGMTDQLGQSQVLPYISGLSKHGYEFHLISCEKPARFEQHKGVIEEICRQNNITWHPLPYTKNPPVLSTVRDVWHITRKAFELDKTHRFSLVHCRGYISALTGLRMKRKLGTAFLFDMRGLWADEKVDAGSWNLKNPVFSAVYNYFKRKEKQFLEESDYTISLTEAARKEILSWKHVDVANLKMDVIPCCADLSFFDPAKVDKGVREKIKTELGITDRDHVLVYLGSIGSWYMLDEMLDFFVCYLRKYPDAKFLFITGDHHDQIRTKAGERKIAAGKILIRPAMRKEVPASISLGKHSVFFIRPTYSKISSSPTKQAELMSMGVPVICNTGVGDTAAVVNKYQSGVTISAFDSSSYQKAIDEVTSIPFDSHLIRKGAFSYFSLDNGVAQYKAIYQQICK